MFTLFPNPILVLRHLIYDFLFFGVSIYITLRFFEGDIGIIKSHLNWIGICIIISVAETLIWVVRQKMKDEDEE